MSGRVDVIIISWNGREDTLECVRSVARQIGTGTDQVEQAAIVVVDNGSTDRTIETLVREFPAVRVLALAENRGFTGGIAAATNDSIAPYIIFINNDAVVERGWLRALVDAMDRAPSDVIAIGGKIIDMDGSRVDFIGGALTFDGHAFQRDFRRRLSDVVEPADGSELLFACGGNMIARREPFSLLGGFDDDFFAYLEDVDFGWRAWLSGWRILYSAEAIARHKSSATSDRLGSFERGVLFEKNALLTAVKNYENALFREASGAIFLTLLHRLHRYVVDRHEGTGALTQPPLGGMTRNGIERSWRRRLGDILRGRSRRSLVKDPLAVMQFRAIEWFFSNLDEIMKKRDSVQAMRKRTDREIFDRFPIHYVPTYHGDQRLMSSALFRFLKSEVSSTDSTLEEMIQL